MGLTLSLAAPTFAAEPSAAEREEAKKAYADARKARADGKLDAALELFRRAHDLAPTPVTRLDLARALVDKHKLLEARELTRGIPSMPVTATETAKSKQSRQEASTLITELDRRIPKVNFTLDRQAEQEVAIDGAVVSKELLSGSMELDPGEHVASVRLGERSVETKFSLAESEAKTLELTSPVAIAQVEGNPIEPTSEVVPTPPIEPREPVGPAPLPAEDTDASLTPAVPVLLSVGGAALLAGAISGGIALSQAGALKLACKDDQCLPAQRDALSTHQDTAAASTTLFVIGGVVAAAGGVVWVIDVATDGPSKAGSVGLTWLGTGVAFHATWL